MKLNYYNRWWFWCSLYGFGSIIILCMTLNNIATHDYTFRFYANDEMVNISEKVQQSMINYNFNDCISSCKTDSCIFGCEEYYSDGDLIFEREKK